VEDSVNVLILKNNRAPALTGTTAGLCGTDFVTIGQYVFPI